MFSGTGYSYNKPILYYAKSLMPELGYDVIQINYTFEQQQFEQEPLAISNMVYNSVNTIVEYCLQTKSYTNAVYLGKSLGTMPIIDFYMQQPSVIPAYYVLFTPMLSLEHTMENLCNKQAFIAIGTADPHYSQEKLAQLTNHHLVILEGADYSLEITDNTMLSLQLCQSAFTQLQTLLRKY
ncbi:hypothetical protein MHB42_01740 [Lysinibacillus sp. FSL K6-0232]|uniref:hypothetical protein n=1 Tax=Lysinibacillus sp. FSL K6-0232 TaxID=2921425 RepID=UPI0030F8134E